MRPGWDQFIPSRPVLYAPPAFALIAVAAVSLLVDLQFGVLIMGPDGSTFPAGTEFTARARRHIVTATTGIVGVLLGIAISEVSRR